MTEFCEKYDYVYSTIEHIRRRLCVGEKIREQDEGNEKYILSPDDCDKIIEFLDERKDSKEPKGFTKTKGRKFLCNRCGASIKKGTERCPNKNCICYDHGFDWKWTLDNLPKKVTWTTKLMGKVRELNKII